MSIFAGDQIQGEFGEWPWDGHPTSLSYQWQSSADGITSDGNVGGATHSDFVTDDGDLGLYFRVGVIATNAGGASAVSYSAWAGPVVVYVPPVDPPSPEPPATLALTPVVEGTLVLTAAVADTLVLTPIT